MKLNRIVLPMLVLRRIDVLLEPTKDAVLERKEQLGAAHFENQAPLLTAVTGQLCVTKQ